VHKNRCCCCADLTAFVCVRDACHGSGWFFLFFLSAYTHVCLQQLRCGDELAQNIALEFIRANITDQQRRALMDDRTEWVREQTGLSLQGVNPDAALSELLNRMRRLSQALVQTDPQRHALAGLLTHLPTRDATAVLGCSAHMVCAERKAQRHDTTLVPGMVRITPKQRTIDRRMKDGRYISEEIAIAMTFFARPDNSVQEQYKTTNGQIRIDLNGKKTIDKIYEEYKAERKAACASYLGRTTFYERAVPPNFHPFRTSTCACAKCKMAAERTDAMRKFTTAVLRESKADKATRESVTKDIETMRRHTPAEVLSMSMDEKHPRTAQYAEQATYDAAVATAVGGRDALTRLTNAQLADRIRPYGVGTSGLSKSQLIERYADCHVRTTMHDPNTCDACRRRIAWFEAISRLLQQLATGHTFTANDTTFNAETALAQTKMCMYDLSIVIDQYEAGHQRWQMDREITALGSASDSSQEVWVFDFSALFKSHNHTNLTHEEYLSTDSTTVFGLVQYRRPRLLPELQKVGAVAERFVYLFVSSDTTHDAIFAAACLEVAAGEARERGVKRVFGWSDNGPHFHCALLWTYQGQLLQRHGIEWIGNHFAPGEGKSDVDRYDSAHEMLSHTKNEGRHA
jgi:hypothetical protein